MSAAAYNRAQMSMGRLTVAHVDLLIEEGARAVQARHGLIVDGEAGPKTQAALDAMLDARASTAPPPAGAPSDYCLPIEGIALPIEAGLLFGYSRVPDDPSTIRDESHEHQGHDLYAPEGTPVLATSAGTVILTQRTPSPKPAAGVSSGGYGCQVVIRHDDGSITRSAHLKKDSIPVEVVNGARVSKGQKIGEVGRTYWAHTWSKERGEHVWRDLFATSNAHLHWEALKRWPVPREQGRVDPLVYFDERGVPYERRRRGENGHLP